jgi:hypothetical protein
MAELTTASPGTEHSARWKWFLALGVVLLPLGLAGAGATTSEGEMTRRHDYPTAARHD